MTILWCGGEGIDFSGSPVASTNTDYKRNDFARCSLYKDAIFPSYPFPGGEITSGWVSGRVWTQPLTSSTYNSNIFGLTDSSGKGLWLKKASGYLSLLLYDGTTWATLQTSASVLFNTGNIDKLDIQLTSYGASANVKVYFNDTLVIDYTGDISISGVTGFACVAGYGKSGAAAISELIAADEDTRLMSLKTLAPVAAGDSSEWTNDYTSIDEVTNSDADTVFTETASQNFQCNLTGMPIGDYIVKAVKVAARMTDGVGGMGVKQGIKTNSTLALSDTITLGGVWETHEQMYQNNPVTSNRFTPAEIEALQLAFQSAAV